MTHENEKLRRRVEDVIGHNDVVMYMKGTSFYPLCGYSAAIAQILNYLGVSYIDVDILKNPELSPIVKDISKWPFIPQLFVKSRFIGGCDKIREMFSDGSLVDLLIKENVSMNAESYYLTINSQPMRIKEHNATAHSEGEYSH